MGSLADYRSVVAAGQAPSLVGTCRRAPTVCISGLRQRNVSRHLRREACAPFRGSLGIVQSSRGQLQVFNGKVLFFESWLQSVPY